MSRPTALDVMRVALQQYRYTESPAGSNRTKFGKAYGWNGVPWCAEFVWWCADKPEGACPIYKSANAADIQDLTVKYKGGRYILKRTASNKKKEAALPSYRFGDQISFNFSGGSDRQHTGLIVATSGRWIWCIEGNTSLGSSGSQSNGGAVALRKRSYTTGVCVDRPDYAPHKWHVPSTPYSGKIPALPADGDLKYKDRGSAVKALQQALRWANGYALAVDGSFGSHTFAEVVIFQVSRGLTPDGVVGSRTLKALRALIDKHKKDGSGLTRSVTVATKVSKAKKTKAQKIVARAKLDAWPYGTPKRKYTYPTGKPRPQYRKDLKKFCPERKHWSTRPEHGRSCDVAVCVIVRATVDRKFPRGHDEQGPYLERSDKFKRVKTAKPGDIIWQVFKSGARHVSIKTSKNRVYNAHYNANTYPVIEKLSRKVRKKSRCKVSRIYRAV